MNAAPDRLTGSVRELGGHNAWLDQSHLPGLLPLAGLQLLSVRAGEWNAPNDPAFARLNFLNYIIELAVRGHVTHDAFEESARGISHERLYWELVAAAQGQRLVRTVDGNIAKSPAEHHGITIITPTGDHVQFEPNDNNIAWHHLNPLLAQYSPIVRGQPNDTSIATQSQHGFVRLLSDRYLAGAYDYLGSDQLSSATPEDRQAGNKWAHLNEVALMKVLLHEKLRAFEGLPPMTDMERESMLAVWTFHDAQLMNIPRLHESLSITVNGEDMNVSIMDVMGNAVDKLLENRGEPITKPDGTPYTRNELAQMAAYVMITDRIPKGELYDQLQQIDGPRIKALRTWIFKNNHYALEWFMGSVDTSSASSHHNTTTNLISQIRANGLDDLEGMHADRLAATGDAISTDEVMACFWRYGHPDYPQNGIDRLDPSLVRFMITDVFDDWLKTAKDKSVYRVTGPDTLPAAKVAADLRDIVARADVALAAAQEKENTKATEENRTPKTLTWNLGNLGVVKYAGAGSDYRQLLLFTDLADKRDTILALASDLDAAGPDATLRDVILAKVQDDATFPPLLPERVAELRALSAAQRNPQETAVSPAHLRDGDNAQPHAAPDKPRNAWRRWAVPAILGVATVSLTAAAWLSGMFEDRARAPGAADPAAAADTTSTASRPASVAITQSAPAGNNLAALSVEQLEQRYLDTMWPDSGTRSAASGQQALGYLDNALARDSLTTSARERLTGLRTAARAEIAARTRQQGLNATAE